MRASLLRRTTTMGSLLRASPIGRVLTCGLCAPYRGLPRGFAMPSIHLSGLFLENANLADNNIGDNQLD
jgi:hypothetical protein